ncbi:hypothetical protein NG796_24655 [Laspinema sp. A4]|nr:hypothetical protein [Laspinema sp. D2d]MCT7986467.1 hypothetical protein [Laspinema sp. D2d]
MSLRVVDAIAELEPDRLSTEQDRDRQTIAEPNRATNERTIARMTQACTH